MTTTPKKTPTTNHNMTIMNPTIKVKLDPGAEMPHYAHPSDVGADVKALRTTLNTLEETERGAGGFGSTAKTKPKASCFACKHLVTPSKCTVQGRTPANMEICVHFCRPEKKGGKA